MYVGVSFCVSVVSSNSSEKNIIIFVECSNNMLKIKLYQYKRLTHDN